MWVSRCFLLSLCQQDKDLSGVGVDISDKALDEAKDRISEKACKSGSLWCKGIYINLQLIQVKIKDVMTDLLQLCSHA